MSGVRIKIGGPFFRKIRENSDYYIDKTAFIEEFLNADPPEASLITRPRRFGKTLMMDMLCEFFDITKDSKALFDGLAISKNKALCDKWMNQYPTLFISFKDIDDLNFEDALGQVRLYMSDICKAFAFLIDSSSVDETDRDDLRTLKSKKGDKVLLSGSLKILCRALNAHYNKPVILLIDEYDLPLARAQENGYYREMVSFIRKMLGAVLKDYKILQFGILTGGLRISKESLFSGLNNFQCFGISEERFADKLGFTSKEVDDLLSATGFSEKKKDITEWYDGYRFGKNTEIYCPWDILQYISFLQDDPDTVPEAYWENSTGNEAIRSLIEHTDFYVREKIEKLLDGGYVTCTIIKTITYDTLYASEDSLWTLLYQAGYLTRADPMKVKKHNACPVSTKTPLIIPNREVRTIFTQTIKSWFDDTMKLMDRKPLLDAFWNGDSKGFQEMFSDILLKAISYNDYHENFYHAILTGLFIGAGYSPESNNESGLGRADIIVTGPTWAHAAVIEVKYTKTESNMHKEAEDALSQIKKTKYVTAVKKYKKIMLWGISFCKKSCEAKAEEYQRLQP